MKLPDQDRPEDVPQLFLAEDFDDFSSLRSWLKDESAKFEQALSNAGCVLFRGFGVDSAVKLDEIVRLTGAPSSPYIHGNSPRTKIGGNVYSSTEYPSHLEISMHNELSYSSHWPRTLFFNCIEPALEGGETPIADGSEFFRTIGSEIRDSFMKHGVRYVQNLPSEHGLGRSWQDTFETTDRDKVERTLIDDGANFEWRSDDSLFVERVRPATVLDPMTGERVWFNQADQWHVSSLPKEEREVLLDLFDYDELPCHATFGDGTEIPNSMVSEITEKYAEISMQRPWERGDVLIVDNIRFAHGRRAFEGERKITVAMR